MLRFQGCKLKTLSKTVVVNAPKKGYLTFEN
jgi:hypothetical protein